ncbi:extensin-like [Penaeus monodon]|uniref:extensin-like n=1 Tax=Penaeus monodon TaxID=6687 RepID=UPI0018A7AB22|nr:extensin-like [Penaeus monodon]
MKEAPKSANHHKVTAPKGSPTPVSDNQRMSTPSKVTTKFQPPVKGQPKICQPHDNHEVPTTKMTTKDLQPPVKVPPKGICNHRKRKNQRSANHMKCPPRSAPPKVTTKDCQPGNPPTPGEVKPKIATTVKYSHQNFQPTSEVTTKSQPPEVTPQRLPTPPSANPSEVHHKVSPKPTSEYSPKSAPPPKGCQHSEGHPNKNCQTHHNDNQRLPTPKVTTKASTTRKAPLRSANHHEGKPKDLPTPHKVTPTKSANHQEEVTPQNLKPTGGEVTAPKRSAKPPVNAPQRIVNPQTPKVANPSEVTPKNFPTSEVQPKLKTTSKNDKPKDLQPHEMKTKSLPTPRKCKKKTPKPPVKVTTKDYQPHEVQPKIANHQEVTTKI